MSSSAAFSLGYQQSTLASQNNLNMIQKYSALEYEIINKYEQGLGPISIKGTTRPYTTQKISYIDENGLIVAIN